VLISKLVIKECGLPFGIALFSAITILLLGKIVPLLDFFIRSGASLKDLLKTCLLFLPVFFQFAIPLAGLIGFLAAFLKLTRDSEILSLFAVGVNPVRLLVPVLVFSTFLFFASISISLFFLPRAKAEVRQYLRELGERRLAQGIPEARFFEVSKGLILFTNKSRKDGKKLKGVFIWDSRRKKSPSMIYAQKGWIVPSNNGRSIQLRLKNGVTSRIKKDYSSGEVFSFDEYVIRIGFKEVEPQLGRGGTGTMELIRMAHHKDIPQKKKRRIISELQMRFSQPLGTVFLCLLGPPLGIFFGRSGISTGIFLGISAFFSYYVLITFTKNLYELGVVGSSLVLWIPNIAAAMGGLVAWNTVFKKGPISLI